MTQVPDTDAIIAALGAPPRAFPADMTKDLPRARRGAVMVGMAFGGLLLLAGGLMSQASSYRDRDNAPVVAFGGALLGGLAGWQYMKRKGIGDTCLHVLANGRATVGRVETLDARRVNATIIDTYEFAYADASSKPHVLKAFWNDPWMRLPLGAPVVILHDPSDPARAAVVPLDYPGLRLKAPEGARPRTSDDDMIETLARLGVPLNFSPTTPTGALLGGVIKAGLYNGVRKMNAGDLDGAIESFDAVISTAQREPAFAQVQAAVHEQRGLAYAKKGDAAKARADLEAALKLDANRTEAAATLKGLG